VTPKDVVTERRIPALEHEGQRVITKTLTDKRRTRSRS